jgi:hypothetical protein
LHAFPGRRNVLVLFTNKLYSASTAGGTIRKTYQTIRLTSPPRVHSSGAAYDAHVSCAMGLDRPMEVAALVSTFGARYDSQASGSRRTHAGKNWRALKIE